MARGHGGIMGVMSAMQSITALASDGGGAKRFRDGDAPDGVAGETVARLQPLLPALGITRVANVTGLDRIGVPVVMVCRPNSRSIAVSQGKGLTLAAAKASGIMEAAEGFHAERIEQPLRLGSSRELGRSLVLADVDGLPLSPDSRWHPDLRAPLDRSDGFELGRAGLGAVRGRAFELHPPAADRQRLFHRHHQWAGLGQPPPGGDLPRHLRDRGTRRQQPVASVREARARCRPDRSAIGRRPPVAPCWSGSKRAGMSIAIWDTTDRHRRRRLRMPDRR